MYHLAAMCIMQLTSTARKDDEVFFTDLNLRTVLNRCSCQIPICRLQGRGIESRLKHSLRLLVFPFKAYSKRGKLIHFSSWCIIIHRFFAMAYYGFKVSTYIGMS
jgi:hypothetical protein